MKNCKIDFYVLKNRIFKLNFFFFFFQIYLELKKPINRLIQVKHRPLPKRAYKNF